MMTSTSRGQDISQVHIQPKDRVYPVDLRIRNMGRHHRACKNEMCATGVFNYKARYGAKPKEITYLDVNKGYAGANRFCGANEYLCRNYPHVCCNQVVNIVPRAGPGPRGSVVVGVCNGQGATKFVGGRVTMACLDAGKSHRKHKHKHKDCPCCPKKWYGLTNMRTGPGRGVPCNSC